MKKFLSTLVALAMIISPNFEVNVCRAEETINSTSKQVNKESKSKILKKISFAAKNFKESVNKHPKEIGLGIVGTASAGVLTWGGYNSVTKSDKIKAIAMDPELTVADKIKAIVKIVFCGVKNTDSNNNEKKGEQEKVAEEKAEQEKATEQKADQEKIVSEVQVNSDSKNDKKKNITTPSTAATVYDQTGMMVKLKSKVNGAIETVKALYNNYGANREKAYWEKMPPELRSNLSTSCHLNKNATFGYKRGFLKEGACCNYYDASGNLKSKWLDSVYRSDVKACRDIALSALTLYGSFRLIGMFKEKYFIFMDMRNKFMSYFKSSKIVKSTLEQTLNGVTPTPEVNEIQTQEKVEEEEANEILTPTPAPTPAPTPTPKKLKNNNNNNNGGKINNSNRKKTAQKFKQTKL